MTTRSMRLPISAARRFSIGLGLLVAVIAVAGFWPTYFGPLFLGTVEKPAVIHFHAAVFSGWVAIFVAQIAFAATGRLDLHRRLGNIAIYYGLAIIPVGIFTAFSQFADRIEAGMLEEAQRRLLAPLTDMIVYPAFFIPAILYRHKPEWHKRLMLVAMTALLVAAAQRMRFLGEILPQNIRTLIWFSPVLIGMTYDIVARRLVHPAYAIGLAVLYLTSLRGALTRTEAWLALSGWFATFVS